ncbi:MAG TPA: glycosyltransferase family 2 protein [Edaphobacter sp.]|nr:glycosyltransferase family 2 protein [Edaphobacter sp.]
MHSLDLSIVIVNWNSKQFVEQCLTSIQANAKLINHEIIVIDNASYDGCKEMLEAKFPDVIFVQSAENLGFARANNSAYSQSRGRNVLFLNPDTEIQGSAIQKLIDALESIPDAGMVGAKLLNSDSTLQTTCITALPSILNQALASNYLRQRFPNWKLWGMRPLHLKKQDVAAVEAVSGACMMAKRDLLERVGCFTVDYFMYAEDMDLCAKIIQTGSKIYYVPEAVIVHHGGGSSSSHSESNFSSVMQRESLSKFFELHRGYAYSIMYRASTAVVSLCRMALILGSFPVVVCVKGYKFWSNRTSKWSAILCWSLNLSRR